MAKKVFIGTITYGALTAPYLALFKESLAKQTYQDFTLVIHNNTNNNLGFGKAYNLMIHQALTEGSKYFLVVNPDLYFSTTALAKLVEQLDKDNDLTAVVPKLKYWDFANKKFTNVIDSCGLGLKNGLIFFDYGQGRVDQGQYDHQLIFGPGGAAALFRLSDLIKITEQEQFFDEHFFMYKEDCDLAYRLFLANLKTKLVSEAVGWHDRSVASGNVLKKFINRFKRSKKVNRWSFINQHYLFIKYWRCQTLISKILIIFKILAMLFEALLFEQYLLLCYKIIFKQAKTLKRY